MTQKVRVGVISTSGFAEWNLIPNTQSHQNAELLSVCGRRLDRATEVAKKHGINKIYTDYRELIRSDENAVVVPNDKLNTLNNNRNGRRNKTLVMPIVQKQVQPVAVPTPTQNSNIVAAKVMRMNAKNLPSNIARLIR